MVAALIESISQSGPHPLKKIKRAKEKKKSIKEQAKEKVGIKYYIFLKKGQMKQDKDLTLNAVSLLSIRPFGFCGRYNALALSLRCVFCLSACLLDTLGRRKIY